MNSRKLRILRSAAVATALLVAPRVRPASAAQERPTPLAEFAAGALLFADEGIVSEGFVGGSARFYVLPRIAIGPEISYIQGYNHSHLILTGNVTFDFLRPVSGQPRRVTPFAVVGGGLYQTRQRFANDSFTSSEGAFTAGVGVRGLVGTKVTLGAEARIGWELHLRFNGMIGVRLGR